MLAPIFTKQASLESAQTETALRQSTSQPNLQGAEAAGAVPAGPEGGGRAPALNEADFPLPEVSDAGVGGGLLCVTVGVLSGC